jgi:hypothetical protein
MPPIAWVGIGCGTILVILVIVVSLAVRTCVNKVNDFKRNPEKAAAEMIVKMNPEWDLVSQDDNAGTMTVRIKESGETVTVSYADVAEGRLTVTGKDGETTTIGMGDMDKVPEWVPRLENADKAVSVFRHEDGKEISGSLHFETSESADDVQEFFETSAEEAGFNSKNASTTTVNGTESRSMEFKSAKRTLNIKITRAGAGEPLMVLVAYSERK